MLPSAAHQNVCDLCSTDCHLRTALILHKLSYHKVHQKHLKISAIAAGEFEVEDRVYSSDSDCEYRVITRIERIPKGKQEAVVNDSILPNDRSEEYTAEVVVDTTPNANVLGDRGDSSLRRFECFVCKKSYKTKAPLIRHISSLHVSSVPTQQKRPPEEQKSYQCKHCDQTFYKRLEYDNHLTSLRDGKPFFCKVCRTGFDAKMELTLHKRNNKICSNPQKPRPYLCTYCGKYFERKDSLTVHTRIHTNDKPFACGTCGKSFIMKSTLQEHMNSHLGIKPYACQVIGCDKRFGFASGLRQHMVNMHEPPTIKCPFCDRMFAKKVHMESHARSHTGEKPYKCEHCPMLFRLMSSLRIHRRTHTGDRPFQCEICLKRFIKSYGLVVHRRNQKKCVPATTKVNNNKPSNISIKIVSPNS